MLVFTSKYIAITNVFIHYMFDLRIKAEPIRCFRKQLPRIIAKAQQNTRESEEKSEREWGEKTDNPFVSVVRDLFALGRRILWSFVLLVTNTRNQRTRTGKSVGIHKANHWLFMYVRMFVCKFTWVLRAWTTAATTPKMFLYNIHSFSSNNFLPHEKLP